jgi:hypothetical protein
MSFSMSIISNTRAAAATACWRSLFIDESALRLTKR